MTDSQRDPRRYRVIELRQRGANLYVLTIDGVVWSEVEWSAYRRAWCVQDAAGHCLTHVEHIHATVADATDAVRLAKRMILDGRMPTPEAAEASLRNTQHAGAGREALGANQEGAVVPLPREDSRA